MNMDIILMGRIVQTSCHCYYGQYSYHLIVHDILFASE